MLFRDKGGVMKHHIIYILVVFLSLGTGLAAAQEPQTEKAALAAEQWLSSVDAGDYSKSWGEAADYLRAAVTEDEWVRSLNAVRTPLGKLVSRKVISSTYMTAMPGAPDGEYVVIQFETSFENKASAIETVTPMLEKTGGWRVSGYYIK
jgi:hypothetical protein